MEIKIRMHIRSRRKAFGISLKELSEKTGISIKSLNLIERGKQIPRLDTMVKIAIALNVGIETLFDVVI